MDNFSKVFTTHYSDSLQRMIRSMLSILLLGVCLSLGSATTAHAQTVKFSPLERKLITWIDAREHVDSLVFYLASPVKNITWRAAIGLANLEDTTARGALAFVLGKELRLREREAIAFALGVLGPNKESMDALLHGAAATPSITSFEAVGRVTPTEHIAEAVQKMIATKSPFVLDGLIQLALRKQPIAKALPERGLGPDLDKLLTAFANHDDPTVRWKTAYYFSRLEDSAYVYAHLPLIRTLVSDLGEPATRMFAATALGRVHNAETDALLTKQFRSETDWRVRTNVVLALGRTLSVDSTILSVLRSAVLGASYSNSATEHPGHAALGVLEQLIDGGKLTARDSTELRDWLLTLQPRRELYPDVPFNIRARVLPVLAKLDSSESMKSFVMEISSERTRFSRDNAIRAIATFDDTTGFLGLLSTMAYVVPREQSAYLGGINMLWQKAKKQPWFRAELEQKRYANAYRNMLIRLPGLVDDPATIGTALGHLQDSTILVDDFYREEARKFFTGYLARFRTPQMVDPLRSLLSTIKWMGLTHDSIMLGVQEVYDFATAEGYKNIADTAAFILRKHGIAFTERPVVKRRQEIDWDLLERSSDTVLISTDRGQMILRLDKMHAPLTSLNVIKLAKMNYFANNVFHRVVPNFVIQAGDPTQTGWGGPGYAIRREVGPVRFDKAGSVGMASSGKDTEGSQWFVTHLPTPHLDSRYTVFGEIVGGKEYVEQIQIYDKITNIFQLTN